MEDYGIKIDNEWLYETITEIKGSNWLYKLLCFIMGRRKKKMTYNEYFLLLYGLNRRKLGEQKAKEMSLNRILTIYKELHNNQLPKGV